MELFTLRYMEVELFCSGIYDFYLVDTATLPWFMYVIIWNGESALKLISVSVHRSVLWRNDE